MQVLKFDNLLIPHMLYHNLVYNIMILHDTLVPRPIPSFSMLHASLHK